MVVHPISAALSLVAVLHIRRPPKEAVAIATNKNTSRHFLPLAELIQMLACSSNASWIWTRTIASDERARSCDNHLQDIRSTAWSFSRDSSQSICNRFRYIRATALAFVTCIGHVIYPRSTLSSWFLVRSLNFYAAVRWFDVNTPKKTLACGSSMTSQDNWGCVCVWVCVRVLVRGHVYSLTVAVHPMTDEQRPGPAAVILADPFAGIG
jgi:hypothetical protein